MAQFNTLDRLAFGIRGYVLLFFLTFVTALPGVFTMPALDRDESRFAQASKQMLETGDYIMIRYQDGMRNKKPAGIHWLQAGTTALFSSAEAKQIWSYRLPSFLGGAFATCFVFWAGIPLIGRRAAFIGALLFSTGLLLTSEAHISKTDGVLVALTTLGIGALVHLRHSETARKKYAILFWFAMGAGFLIKGPVTPMVVFLAMVSHALWQRDGVKWPALVSLGLILVFIDNYFNFGGLDQAVGYVIKGSGVVLLALCSVRFVRNEWREDWFKAFIWWPGPVLWVAMVLPWFLSIQMATDGAFFQGAVGKDLKDKVVGASEGHGGPPGYHLLHLFSHFFPATLFLIPALTLSVKSVRQKFEDFDGVKFLISWTVPTWIVFEFLPTKLSHYVLPAYPALALLAGYAAWKLIEGVKLPVSRFASLIVFLVGALLIAAISSRIGVSIAEAEAFGDFKTADAADVAASWAKIPVIEWPLVFVLVFIAAAALTFVLKRYQLAIAFALLTSVTLGWHVRVTFLPKQTWVQATTTARAALAEVCGLPDQEGCGASPSQIHAIGYAEPSFVFTTGTEVKIDPDSSAALPPASEAPIMAYVVNFESKSVAPGTVEAIIAAAKAQNRCVRKSVSHYAWNYSNGDPAHFIALRVEDKPCDP